jgi:putative transposase
MKLEKEKSNQKYPSDMNDEEWDIIKSILEEVDPYKTGRPREVDIRNVLNAIFYLNKTGCQWRYLPNDFPPYTLVSYYYQKWVDNCIWAKINSEIRRQLREKSGRPQEPSAAIIDSQSVKGTPESWIESGFDGGKLVKGRKRHIVVDTIGCVLVACAHAANIFDGTGARQVIPMLFDRVSSVKRIWADSAYSGIELSDWVKTGFDCVLEVVKKDKGQKGFHVLPHRWIVERTLAWLVRARRLSKDFERKPTSSESQTYIAASRLMLRQICGTQIAYE